jgi:hypothetical protein
MYSHEETSEVSHSSSTVLRRFTPTSNGGITQSIRRERALQVCFRTAAMQIIWWAGLSDGNERAQPVVEWPPAGKWMPHGLG